MRKKKKKNIKTTLHRNVCVCTAQHYFCCCCFFQFLLLFLFCSEPLLWLLWWWRNVTLVCDYLYEVCTRFPPTWVIAFFLSLFPSFPSSVSPPFFLIKLTNNKRAAADRKSMRLGQPCGLRRRPDTDAFYAAGWRGRAGPRQAPARLNTHTYTHTHKKKPLSNRPPRSMAESATATTVHSCSSDKRLMLSNKEGCIHLERANVTTTEEVRKRKGGCEYAREREAGWQVAASPAPEIVAVVRQREVS